MLYHFKKLDWILIVAAVLLVGLGILSIYSSSLGRGDFLNFKKQLIFGSIGLILMFLLSFFDWRSLKENSYLIFSLYFVCLLLLGGLFFFAPEIRGTKSWYRIGPFSIDPIDVVKVVLIVLLAKYFSMRHVEMYRIKHILLSGIYVFLPSIMVFFQPNFGSTAILLAIWLGILIISGIRLRHFLLLVLGGLIIFAASWQLFLKDYQKERIISFVRPQAGDLLEIGWNQRQSKIAVGSGRVWGQGLGSGSQTQYGFLPEPQTDFIFAALAEETGLAGISVLFILFSILIWRITKIATASTNNFPRLFASGIIILLISQIFINIGMNIGLLPIVGISLPFISYGGDGLIIVFISLGIVQSIKINS